MMWYAVTDILGTLLIIGALLRLLYLAEIWSER